MERLTPAQIAYLKNDASEALRSVFETYEKIVDTPDAIHINRDEILDVIRQLNEILFKADVEHAKLTKVRTDKLRNRLTQHTR